MAILKHLVVPKTARYFQSNEISLTTENIWIVLHGYGHLAEYFIRKFESLNTSNSIVIAPEGFHRFYLQGVSGRVGASWMTKEDRENDIKDYQHYLNNLLEEILKTANKNVKVNIIGFSQGGATACRFATYTNIKINLFVLLSSVFPPDFNFDLDKIKSISKVIAIIGDEDEYVKVEEFKNNIHEWNNKGLNCKAIVFKGKHEINTEALSLIKAELP